MADTSQPDRLGRRDRAVVGRPRDVRNAMRDSDMSMRTPLGRVRGLGSARSGTRDFWLQRLTAIASVPLTIAGVVLVISLTGRSYPAVKQILASPLVAVTFLLFIL